MSENGWTDDFLCTQWFCETFIPHATERNTSGAPILLIYDGHGSHTTAEMCTLAEEHNIELPPTSHYPLNPAFGCWYFWATKTTLDGAV
jgi:hypothetical protein